MADTSDTKKTEIASEKTEDAAPEVQNTETEDSGNPKVFVGNLSFKTDEDELKEAFVGFGGVVSANIITRGPRSLGYGFVEFDSIESAEKAIAAMHQKELGGREINVELARARVVAEKKPRRKRAKRGKGSTRGGKKRGGRGGKAEGAEDGADDNENENSGAPKRKRKPRKKADLSNRIASTTTLFVANLPFSTTDDELKALFSAANATSAYVVRRRNETSKGYGFVEFANEEDQQQGLQQDKVEVDGRELSVKVALQQPESENKEESNDNATSAEAEAETKAE